VQVVLRGTMLRLADVYFILGERWTHHRVLREYLREYL